jgi:hypothetical protein
VRALLSIAVVTILSAVTTRLADSAEAMTVCRAHLAGTGQSWSVVAQYDVWGLTPSGQAGRVGFLAIDGTVNTANGPVTVTRRLRTESSKVPRSFGTLIWFVGYGAGDQKPNGERMTGDMNSVVATIWGDSTPDGERRMFFTGDFSPPFSLPSAPTARFVRCE